MSLTEEIDNLSNEVQAKWLLIDHELPIDVFMKMVAAEHNHMWQALRLIAQHVDARN
ncbi:hypothetical protein [Subtercola sp. RTI3]|uniref:hypothetical protein n=1 Tax=Subtercola sp. RTI3 TaxID=3048639 RepID=UPI002B22ECC4|nr:hypothetical protein [Subtercola sp. RTI3]MEA9984282.1 hypothetical protein [Subtercola sp. RTI3]